MNSDFEIDSSSSSSADFCSNGMVGELMRSVLVKSVQGAKGNGLIEGSPNLHYQIYNGNGISGQLFQRISGLPAGSYKVQAVICPGNTEGVAFYMPMPERHLLRRIMFMKQKELLLIAESWKSGLI